MRLKSSEILCYRHERLDKRSPQKEHSSRDFLAVDALIIFPVADSCYGNTECQQNCVNIVDGTFFCACGTGYTINDDGRTCTGKFCLELQTRSI